MRTGTVVGLILEAHATEPSRRQSTYCCTGTKEREAWVFLVQTNDVNTYNHGQTAASPAEDARQRCARRHGPVRLPGQPACRPADHELPRPTHARQRIQYRPIRFDGADRGRSRRHARRIGGTHGVYQSTLSRDLRGLETAGLVKWLSSLMISAAARVAHREGARRLQAAIPLWRDAHAAIEQRLDPRLALRLSAATEELVE